MKDQHADETQPICRRPRGGAVDQVERALDPGSTFFLVFEFWRHTQCLTEILLMKP
jgi:hypothetical protein